MKIKQFLVLMVVFLAWVPPAYAGPVSIQILKEPDIQYVYPGGIATFRVTVVNTGSMDLDNVVVTDPLTPDCDWSVPFPLQPGTSVWHICQTGPVSEDFTNTVTVTADSPSGPVNAINGADVIVTTQTPLAITKAPASQTVERGEAATFTITVENLSAQAVTNVFVTDLLSPDCHRNLPDLPAMSSTNYTCQSGPVNDEFVNTATVTGTYNSFPYSDSDSAVVNLPGGGGGGCNTVGPARSSRTDLLWIAMLGGIVFLLRRREQAAANR